MEQVIGRHVVGDVQIDLVVVVEVGGDDAQPATVGIDEARLRSSRRQTARGHCGKHDREAIGKSRGMHSCLPGDSGCSQSLGLLGIVSKVVADIEIQVAVAVQVGEGRRGRPVAIAAQARRARSRPRTGRRPLLR